VANANQGFRSEPVVMELFDRFSKVIAGISSSGNSTEEQRSELFLQLTELACRAHHFDCDATSSRGSQLHMEYLRLKGICKNAELVVRYAPNAFPWVRRKLFERDAGNLYGSRLELHIAARLAMLNIAFSMPDPPDFYTSPLCQDIFSGCIS